MALGAPACGQLWDLLVKNTDTRPYQQLGGCPKGCSEVPQTRPRESGLRERPRPEPQRFTSYLACGVELPGIFGLGSLLSQKGLIVLPASYGYCDGGMGKS